MSSLFAKGEDAILRKVTEETTELVLASKEGTKKEIVHEATDLFFHMMVLLAYKNVDLLDVFDELKKRRR